MSNANDQDKNPQNKLSADGISAAQWLIHTLINNSSAVLLHDQRNVVYIAYNGDGTRVDELASAEFRNWLAYFYWRETNKPLPKESDSKVIQTLTGYARYEGERFDLNVRQARAGECLWYDLSNGTVVKISSAGWSVIDKPPILFRRYSHQQSQVTPDRDGDAELIRQFVNIPDEDSDTWLLFVVNLISAFIPGYPHPLLVLHGPQGAGKSTPLRVMKKLVDPSVLLSSLLPSNEADFGQLAEHHALLTFDNLSTISPKMSDALARASTGDGSSSRKLYTTDDDFVRIIQRPIAMNGINQVITKLDLLDRSILIKLQRIPREQRVSEESFWEALDAMKPLILGGIFDVLSKVLAIYPTIALENAPRMADFAKFGSAIAIALGRSQEEFLSAYQSNLDLQNEEAIEASPVAKAVIAFMRDNISPVWEGTPAQLLTALNKRVENLSLSSSPLWPKAPEWMTRRLNEAQVNLEAIGIHVDTKRTDEGRYIVLTIDRDNTDSTDMPTDDENDSMSVLAVDF